ncbi:MAG: Competence protein ComEA helix-hairpin-helix repeat region [Bacteroidetes bacterium]|nr:Competence protein ComEA helix-hairpin-helix repeat region [Bacteroidota bacterium]
MKWKDFFYYSESDKKGILLLLVLVIGLLLLRVFWNNSDAPPDAIRESDSLKTAFETFQKTLIEDERMERNRAYEERRKAFYEKYKQKDYAYKEYKPYEKQNYPTPTYQKQEKLSPGQTILVNEADTADWKKIPGIGSGYAKRIVKYRDLLGGFVSADQLKEVYGVSEELFGEVKPYLKLDSHIKKLAVNQLSMDQFRGHPYLNYKQARTIVDLRQRRGKISSIKTLQMLDEFSEEDIRRLSPYLSFE